MARAMTPETERKEMADTTPTYIAYCPDCTGLLACVVADVASQSMAAAVRYRQQWEKAGLRVETLTVQDVRDHKGKLGHQPTCTKAKPRQRKLPDVPKETP